MEEEKKVAKNEPETKDVSMDSVMKQKLADMVMNLGKGRGMNTQELVAITKGMKKNKLDINEMMGMMMMKKMMGGDDGKKMNPMEMMMIMQMMNSGGSKETEWQKKFEDMQKQMLDDRKTTELKSELAKLAENIKSKGGDFGIKEMMAMWAERDRSSEKWRSENDRLKNEIMMKEFGGAVGNISEEIKKIKEGGGDIEKVGKTVELIKKMGDQLGFGKEKEKTGSEIAAELIQGVAKSIAPAINEGMKRMPMPGQGNPGPGIVEKRLKELQDQRNQQQGSAGAAESKPVEEHTGPEFYIDEHGKRVYPSLLSLSEDKNAKE